MHQAVSRALAHVKAAQTALEEAVPNEEPESLHHGELVSAYRALQREHDELRAQYEADKQTWREFKRWWKHKLQTKREARRMPWSPRKAREQIQAHRRQVRSLMNEQPGLFKGTGRYAPKPTAKEEAQPETAPEPTPPDYWYVKLSHRHRQLGFPSSSQDEPLL